MNGSVLRETIIKYIKREIATEIRPITGVVSIIAAAMTKADNFAARLAFPIEAF